jgi:hypothetical protein
MTSMTPRRKLAVAATAAAVILVGCGRAGTPRSSSTTTGSVRGHVTAGPTCPVERVGIPCPPRPVIARISATTGTRVVATTRSTADGSYRLDVAGGTYVITATPATAFPRCDSRQTRVDAARVVTVDITCDTGIR